MFFLPEIVSQDSLMVKGQGEIDVFLGEYSDVLGVIPGDRDSPGFGHIGRGYRVPAGIPVGRRVRVELEFEGDLERGLF